MLQGLSKAARPAQSRCGDGGEQAAAPDQGGERCQERCLPPAGATGCAQRWSRPAVALAGQNDTTTIRAAAELRGVPGACRDVPCKRCTRDTRPLCMPTSLQGRLVSTITLEELQTVFHMVCDGVGARVGPPLPASPGRHRAGAGPACTGPQRPLPACLKMDPPPPPSRVTQPCRACSPPSKHAGS